MIDEKIFIGIDLAWTYNNETGICLLNQNGEIKLLESKVYDDQEIVEIIQSIENIGEKTVTIGIDAPLIFPACESEYRTAERKLKRNKINGFSISSFQVSKSYMKRIYGSARGEVISQKLCQSNTKFIYTNKLFENKYEVIETFPTAIVAGIFPDIFPNKYKIKGKIADSIKEYNKLYEKIYELEKSNIIKNFSEYFSKINDKISRKAYKNIEDKLDSFLCSLGMFLIFHEKARELYFGDVNTGIIFLPVKE
ncbi:MAG: DUF429 domain-containing protein [Sebaldella sp.]|nr:DUF429 domain-containing protein [Sebaldella sp.]